MKRAVFYDFIRSSVSGIFRGRLSRQQVRSTDAILDAFVQFGNGKSKSLAYALATAYHETGTRMEPVREGFARTDQHARAIVAERKYGAAGSSGHVYYGRGHVQLTWEKNYRETGERLGIDLVSDPDRMLEPELSARVLVEGLIDGRWNADGFGIEHYLPDDGPDDLEGARRTVNITDKWSIIAGHYRVFLSAIEAAGGVPLSNEATDCFYDVDLDPIENPAKPDLVGALLPVLVALIELAGKTDADLPSKRTSRKGIFTRAINTMKPATQIEAEALTPINAWLGEALGRFLDGRKTGFGIAGMLVTVLLPILLPGSGTAILDALAPGAANSKQVAAEVSNLLTTIFAALAGWGVLGKAEKWVNELAQR